MKTKALKLPRQSEESFQAQVLQLAAYCGWVRAHFRPARTAAGWRTPVAADGAGFPDLVLVRRGRLIFAELKRDGKSPTPDQAKWLALLRECPGAEVHTWRPNDWPDIERALS